MGTRSLTVFTEDNGKEICVMYRQFDGYPDCHGRELSDFLKEMPIVIGYSDPEARQANGLSCLSAQVIAHFKKCVGGYYLFTGGTRNMGEEYIYTISAVEGTDEATISISESAYGDRPYKELFKGKASAVCAWISSASGKPGRR